MRAITGQRHGPSARAGAARPPRSRGPMVASFKSGLRLLVTRAAPAGDRRAQRLVRRQRTRTRQAYAELLPTKVERMYIDGRPTTPSRRCRAGCPYALAPASRNPLPR